MTYPRRIVTQENLDTWPLYAPLGHWCEVVNMSKTMLMEEIRKGRLTGERVGLNRYYFTKEQILRWYAPGLFAQLYQKESVVKPQLELEIQ